MFAFKESFKAGELISRLATEQWYKKLQLIVIAVSDINKSVVRIPLPTRKTVERISSFVRFILS
ncbi:hypothetical protein L8106_27489 [Lyngbya sp. PCC 8106]|nr:hypothetical protein L8106_27489 [Lyngbya sp. PCC 8106]